MFTLEQIEGLHARLGKAATLAKDVRALRAIGVVHSDSWPSDGHSEYFGAGGHTVRSPPTHDELTIAERGDREGLRHHLKLHEQGRTTYIELSRGLAASGVAR